MRPYRVTICFVLVPGALTGVAAFGLHWAAYGFVIPVQVAFDEATLGRLALAAPAGGNGTVPPASVAYNLSLAVALRNPNWMMRAELRFRCTPLARVRLAGAWRHWIGARRTEVYHAAAAAKNAPVALGPDGAAELARESAAGVFELELSAVGEVKYYRDHRRRSIRVNCPLKLSLSTATATAAFARVKCT